MHVFAIGFATGVDVVADLMIVALSLAVLRTLQLDKSKKWGVAAAFSLVVMIIMAAKLRVELVVDNEEFDMVGLAIWSVVETMTALIVGSLMPLSGLLSKAISKISSNRSKSRRYPQRIDDQDSRSVQLEDSASNTGLFRKSRASRSVTVIGGAGSSNEQITKDNYSTSDGDELALNSTTSHRWRSGV